MIFVLSQVEQVSADGLSYVKLVSARVAPARQLLSQAPTRIPFRLGLGVSYMDLARSSP